MLPSIFSADNFDLLAVGITSAAIILLGVLVYISNRKSATARAFLFFAIATIAYSFANYLNYQDVSENLVLWFLRFTLFTAVWHAFSFFNLAYVFPSTEKRLSKKFNFFILASAIIASLVTLTPFALSGIANLAPPGQASTATHGPGMLVFALVSVFLVFGGIFFLIRKALRSKGGIERRQFTLFTLGVLVTFLFIIFFNVVLPIGFQNTSFIPLAPVFFFPLIGLTALSILRLHLFNVKVAAVASLAFLLSIAVLFRVVLSNNATEIVFGASQFVLVVIFSIWLLQATLKEVEQREEIQILAESLKKANERLKELDKLKSQFLSIASHDLRAPLTTIRNFMSLLLDGTYGKIPQAAEEGMHQVFERATEMAKSVDDYLNVSRIEQGRMKYDFAETDVVKIVSETAASFKPVAEKNGLSLSFRGPADLKEIPVTADIAKLHEIFSLLIDNSIKYTPKGSIQVTVEQSTEGNKKFARITIKDTGIGISKETMPKLFKLFSTGAESAKVNTSSTGVGLYVVKAIVEAHKGTVRAESEGEGKGSSFIVELPILL